MSICINNDLIWIAVPRCASTSIEKSIIEHPNIKYQHILDINPNLNKLKDKHLHVGVDILKYWFGNLETVCIKRDWMDHWLSAFEYIWQSIKVNKLTPKYNFEEVDNEFIYKMFTDSFLYKLQIVDDETHTNLMELYELFINEKLNENKNVGQVGLRTLCSQNFWVNNEKCTYEFDIKDLDKFEKFISDRCNIDFKVKHINKSKKLKNNIVVDDKLKNFIWNKFEKPFIKRQELI